MAAIQNPMFNHLKASLMQLLCLFSSLNFSQARKINAVEKCLTEKNGECVPILSKKIQKELPTILSTCSVQELTTLVNFSQNSKFTQISDYLGAESCIIDINDCQGNAFASLFRVLLLQEALHTSFSPEDIISLKKIIPKYKPDEQLRLVQQLQIVMNEMTSEQIEYIFNDIQEKNEKSQILFQLLENYQDRYIIYETLREFFNLQLSQIIRLFSAIPRLHQIQTVQMVKLLQLDILSMIEIRQLLNPNKSQCANDDEIMEDYCDTTDVINDVSIQILDKLPDQAVYKRNLSKPCPSILISSPKLEGGKTVKRVSYRVVPTILRCDTQEEIQGALIGDHSQVGTVGSILKFKKLKIQVTSRQVGDVLFCIRFSLFKESSNSKKLKNNPDFNNPLCVIQSTPIQIVSHSSLIVNIKKAQNIQVTEVIPSSGSVSGNTRLAILGNNFPDASSLHVYFDGKEVKAEPHGPNTIICYSPPHLPGEVNVCVSSGSYVNDGNGCIKFQYLQENNITHHIYPDQCGFPFHLSEDEYLSTLEEIRFLEDYEMT